MKFRGLSRPAVGTAALGLLWVLLLAWIGLRLAGRAPDDMYITYRYAWNLAHGEGFVFNPGERVFGLTNPGLGLLLALLHGVTRVPVHLLGTAVYAASLWALALFLWGEGRRRGFRLEAGLGGTLVLGSSYVWLNQGSAAVTVLALLAGSAVLAERRPVTAGLLAGAAVWFRPDAGLGVAALGLLLWVGGRRFPWRWTAAAGGTIVAGLVAAWAWFGTPLPRTLEAKRIMAEARAGLSWSGPSRFWARVGRLAPRHWGELWQLAAAMGIAGLWPLFARGGRAVRTLVLYAAAVAVAYPLLGVPFFAWYVVPPVVVALYGLCALAGGAGRSLGAALSRRPEGSDRRDRPGAASRALPRMAGAGLALALLAAPVIGIVAGSSRWISLQGDGTRYQAYREAALWIRENTLPEHRVAYGEIGNLAYWSRRPVDDPMGLVTPQALPYVAAGDGTGVFLRLRPDVWIDHPDNPHPGIVERPFFRRAYYPVAEVPPPDQPDGPPVTIYRRRPDAPLPPSRPPAERRPRRRAGAPRPSR